MTPANRQLLELVDANPVCADCGSTQPPATWVVMSANADNRTFRRVPARSRPELVLTRVCCYCVAPAFATFVCPRCVGVHRGIGAERIVPKSATLDPEYFTAEVVQVSAGVSLAPVYPRIWAHPHVMRLATRFVGGSGWWRVGRKQSPRV